MSVLKKLASETAWYGLSSILGRVVNYFLIPLYTTRLSPAENGVTTELYAYAAFFNVLLTFGMETAFFRFARHTPSPATQPSPDLDPDIAAAAGAASPPEQEGPALTTRQTEDATLLARRAQTLVAAVCALVGLAVTFLLPWLSAALAYPAAGLMISLLAVTLIIDALSALPLAQLRLAGRPRAYAFLRFGSILLNVGFNLLFLLALPPLGGLATWLGADVQPVLWVLLAGLLSTLIYLPAILCLLPSPALLGRAGMQAMVRYAFPIMIMGLAGMTNEMLGRLLLRARLPEGFYPSLSNAAALGVYGNCYKLSVFMALAIQAFRLGAEPFFFRQAGQAGAQATYALVMRWFVLACCAIMLGVSLNLDWLGPLFLRRDVYLSGLPVVPILLLANLWLGVYYNLSIWFKLTDRTKWGTILSAGGAIVTVALNLALIPWLGYMGSALATLICYSGMAAASYLLGRRYYPIPYQAARLGILALACFGASVIFLPCIIPLGLAVSWAYRLVIFILFGLYIYAQARKPRVRPS